MAKVQDLTAQIRRILRDADQDIWTDGDIQDWLRNAELAVALYRPDSTTVDDEHTCVAGTRQALDPQKVARLLSVLRNGTSGAPGPAIMRVPRETLDAIDPNWHMATEEAIQREYVYDDRQPHTFYVSPPAQEGNRITLSYSAIPPSYGTVTETTQTSVNDIYSPALIEWALYRCFSQDTEGTVNVARSSQHLNTFGSILGVKLNADTASSPKQQEHKR